MTMKMYPRPTGELQGDSSPLPDKGTGTAVGDNYGADLSPDSTNRIGGISGATKSDTMGDVISESSGEKA
jgi:hypothetical protein